jgi:anti-sigma B factor antagonist
VLLAVVTVGEASAARRLSWCPSARRIRTSRADLNTMLPPCMSSARRDPPSPRYRASSCLTRRGDPAIIRVASRHDIIDTIKEQPMEMKERESGGVTILDLSGRITQGGGDLDVKDRLQSLVQQGRKNIVLNMANLSYIDSAGLGGLVSAHTTLSREGGRVKLANVTKKLQDLLSITKLYLVFETFDSEAAAVDSFGDGKG